MSGAGDSNGGAGPRALVARDGALAVVSVNRPEARNALDGETLDALHDAFATLERDASVRCAILTGAGGKAFAAGADIKAMADADRRAPICWSATRSAWEICWRRRACR